jgi:predicted RNA-binding Zn-ribbon protein involved in translation (DUF1610 family)
MKIGNKDFHLKTNVVDKKCKNCGNPLKFKAQCCGQKENYLVCSFCGYKEIVK